MGFSFKYAHLLLLISIVVINQCKTALSLNTTNNLNKSKLIVSFGEERFIELTRIDRTQLETEWTPSFEPCVPFVTCSSTLNRQLLLILFVMLILVGCFYFACHECHNVNRFHAASIDATMSRSFPSRPRRNMNPL